MTEATTVTTRREPVVAGLAPERDPPPHPIRDPSRSRTLGWLAVALFAAVAAAFALWRWPAPAPAVPAPEPAAPAASASPGPAAPPAVRYPIERAEPPASAAAAPLPALADSDAPLIEALASVPGASGLERLLVTPNVVRRIVATVDNLPRASVASQVMAVQPAAGALAVDREDTRITIARANDARYAAYLRVLTAIDTPRLVATYARFYPLFQDAYRELGYPGGYFNDRLVDVIDHLLATPEPALPPALVQPRVLYEYANPDLEARSAGQKALLRMSPDHARAVKAKLRELRAALTRAAPQAAAR